MIPVNSLLNRTLRPALDSARSIVSDAVRDIVVGDEPPAPPVWDPADPGWFGPDSVVRQVHSDASGFIGGVRSLLFQALHPAAVYAVCEHSSYRDDPLGRLQRTGAFLGATVFGTGSEAQQAVDIVRSIHSRVTGTLPDGTPYVADDPHLLGWVHITEIDSFLTAYQRYGSETLTDTEADAYVAEMAQTGLALGMTEAPQSVEELAEWLDRYRPELRSTHESEEITRFLLSAPGPAFAKAPYAVILSGALGSLEPWARGMLNLPLLPGTNPLLIRPAAELITGAMRWAMTDTFGDPTNPEILD